MASAYKHLLNEDRLDYTTKQNIPYSFKDCVFDIEIQKYIL